MKYFSAPKITQKEAEQLHQPEALAYDPAAVFRTKKGLYVMALMRVENWSLASVTKAADEMRRITDCEMVSYCEPLLGIWKNYTSKHAKKQQLLSKLDNMLTKPDGRLNEVQRLQREKELKRYLSWVEASQQGSNAD